MQDLDKVPSAYRRDGSTEASSIESDESVEEQKVSDVTFETIAGLPRDVGWFLLVAGLVSELGMPGVPPFWIFGILILWPRTGAPLAARLERHAPRIYRGSLRTLNRYARDLERRYPLR
jgi:hypothetical protein